MTTSSRTTEQPYQEANPRPRTKAVHQFGAKDAKGEPGGGGGEAIDPVTPPEGGGSMLGYTLMDIRTFA